MTTDTKPTFQASAESIRLQRRMADMKAGDVITYAEIAELIGSDPQHDGYHIVQSARKALQREKLMTFGTVAKVGVKRLDGVETLDSSVADTRRIHKAAVRSSKRLACADPNDLPQAKRVTYYGTATVLAVISASTTTKSMKAVEVAASKTNGVLPYKDAMLSIG